MIGRLPAVVLVTVVLGCSLAAAPAAVSIAARQVQLGRSQDGRPIVAVRVGDPQGTRVLVVGCIHGTEGAGIAVARALERVKTRLDLWLVPNLNPDGYVRGTRQNGRGVDLSANWSSQWRGGGRAWVWDALIRSEMTKRVICRQDRVCAPHTPAAGAAA